MQRLVSMVALLLSRAAMRFFAESHLSFRELKTTTLLLATDYMLHLVQVFQVQQLLLVIYFDFITYFSKFHSILLVSSLTRVGFSVPNLS